MLLRLLIRYDISLKYRMLNLCLDVLNNMFVSGLYWILTINEFFYECLGKMSQDTDNIKHYLNVFKFAVTFFYSRSKV